MNAQAFAPTYLDWNATTPLDEAVREAMLPWLGQRFGNASSRHEYGRSARAAIDQARMEVADAVGAHPTEVVFTSGGSESNNLFIKGAAAMLKPGLVAVSAIEHPCVREPARQLIRFGWQCAEIGVDSEGLLSVQAWQSALADRPTLVSVMLANNESGVVQDIAALAEDARAFGVWFHTDAVQALGKMELDFRALGVHAMTLSAHKLGGPVGVGALVVDKRLELAPLVAGGGQERGLRSGTENVAAIVGFGVAAQRAKERQRAYREQVEGLRDELQAGLLALGARVFSVNAPRLPNTVFFAIDGLDGETLVGKLDRLGFACASGSACSSAQPEPSHTLLAMGVDAVLARSAVRVSLGPTTNRAALNGFLTSLSQLVDELRNMTAIAV